MSVLKNDRLLRALLRQPVDRAPAWIMRQAGRYLPEYRALRAKVPDFMTFCKTPELACEVTLQPLRRFPLDAAIIFSDILTIPDAMGLDLQFMSGEGPVIHDPIRSEKDLQRLRVPETEQDLSYVMDAIKLVTRELKGDLPLLGFAGSPWTVATYMVEGRSSKTFQTIKTMLYREPKLLHALLEKITQATIDYLNAQIKAGVSAVMLFDSWGGVLSPAAYQEFSLAYMRKIGAAILREFQEQKIPLIFFTKGAAPYLEAIATSGCDAVGLDWTVDIQQARLRIGDKVALQGNMDPCVLFSSPERIRAEVNSILDAYGPGSGHIFNLGHGIDKETPIESVGVMLEALHRYYE